MPEPKPLKGKRIKLLGLVNEDRFAFYEEDVKSAVQGLLEETDEFIKKCRSPYTGRIYLSNKRVEELKSIIKKWLADAVVEDETKTA